MKQKNYFSPMRPCIRTVCFLSAISLFSEISLSLTKKGRQKHQDFGKESEMIRNRTKTALQRWRRLVHTKFSIYQIIIQPKRIHCVRSVSEIEIRYFFVWNLLFSKCLKLRANWNSIFIDIRNLFVLMAVDKSQIWFLRNEVGETF